MHPTTKPVENAIRPFTLGCKNWLFSATPHGAKASANLYTLIETAKANRLDPHAILDALGLAKPAMILKKSYVETQVLGRLSRKYGFDAIISESAKNSGHMNMVFLR